MEKKKNSILSSVARKVKQIQELAVKSGPNSLQLSNHDLLFCELIESLDQAFLHGLRDITHGYWLIVKQFTHKMTVKDIYRCDNVTTNMGRGRAWLYTALSDHLLESYIHCFESNQSNVQKYYVTDALVCDRERIAIMSSLLAGLDCVIFKLEVDVPYLDLSSYLPVFQLSSHSKENTAEVAHVEYSYSVSSQLKNDFQGRLNSLDFPTINSADDEINIVQNRPKLRKKKQVPERPTSDDIGDDTSLTESIVTESGYQSTQDQLAFDRSSSSSGQDDAVTDKDKQLTMSAPDAAWYSLTYVDENELLQSTEESNVVSSRNSKLVEASKYLESDSKHCCAENKSLEGHEFPSGKTSLAESGVPPGAQSADLDFSDSSVVSKTVTKIDNNKNASKVSEDIIKAFNDIEIKIASDSDLKTVNEHDGNKGGESNTKITVNGSDANKYGDSNTKLSSDYDIHTKYTKAADAGSMELFLQREANFLDDVIQKSRANYDLLHRSQDDSGDLNFSIIKQELTANVSRIEPVENQKYERESIDCDEVENFDNEESIYDRPFKPEKLESLDEIINDMEHDHFGDKNVSSKTQQDQCSKSLPTEACFPELLRKENDCSVQYKRITAEKRKTWQSSSQNSPAVTVSPSKSDGSGSNYVVSADNTMKLSLMLEVFQNQEETLCKIFRVTGDHTRGFPKPLLLVLTDKSLYIVTSVYGEQRFQTNFMVAFKELDYVTVSLNYQYMNFVCTNRRKQYWLTPGNEILTKLILSAIQETMDAGKKSNTKLAILTDATTQKIALRKWAANESRIDVLSIELISYNLIFWEDLQTKPSVIDSSDKEGMLVFRPPNSLHWRSGYFVLRNCSIRVYASQHDNSPPLLVVNLREDCIGCRRSLQSDRQHSFEVLLSNGTTFLLAANTEDDLNDWLQNLCRAVSSNDEIHFAGSRQIACCCVLTNDHLLLCHEDVETNAVRTLASAQITDITEVLIDSAAHTFCVLVFESQDTAVTSEKWVLFFNVKSERDGFLVNIGSCWSEHFGVDLPVSTTDDVPLQRKCRDSAAKIRHLLS